jgi:hypothetical protein
MTHLAPYLYQPTISRLGRLSSLLPNLLSIFTLDQLLGRAQQNLGHQRSRVTSHMALDLKAG